MTYKRMIEQWFRFTAQS